jgi:murein DD-endopeptidase MepM/ murein hydrolase activator NlpD
VALLSRTLGCRVSAGGVRTGPPESGVPHRAGLAFAAGLCAVLLLALAPTATAQGGSSPAPPTAPLDRLAALDATAQQLDDQIASAQVVLAQRRGELRDAHAAAADAVAVADQRTAEAEALQGQVDDLVRAVNSGARTSRLSALLVSTSPQDLLDRMSALDLLGADSAARLGSATAARVAAEQASSQASSAADRASRAEADAVTVQQVLAAQRAQLDGQSNEAAALRGQLRTDAATGSAPQLAASEQAGLQRASRSAALRSTLFAEPTTGTITSPYGPRDGTTHNGVDVANNIGTPIYAVADGVVLDAGPASGFGLWIRLQHDDGTITVYGHIDSYSVSVGQRVLAGEQIARMGNRGQSSGPHLHLEVHTPAGLVDPVSWLSERGVPL